MDKTLVKTKIVLGDNGRCVTIYMWKKTFLFFGYWYPFGTSSSSSKISETKIKRINDNKVSDVLYEHFIRQYN